MEAVVGFLKGFARFWYDFVVGDDPKIAVGVGSVLVLGAVLAATDRMSGGTVVLVAGLLFAAFAVSMVVDVTRSRNRS
jgi:hypothetical protein